ncbi:hypothetical protein ACJIZ3_018127 [Penstemon smallii]|uniref:UBC core domain-containing protein n=1 Tax=Penstemon smallii TaxID=265156 RepID=A0ABD3SXI3_9LAMI
MENPPPEKLIFVHRDQNGVSYVIINRPKSLNSLTRPMMVDLAKEIKSLASDDSVRVIILSGSGRAFCSGVDLTSAEDVFKGDVKDLETDPVEQMERCKKPIIGAINGFAVTAGFEIALACDVLVASKEAKFMDTHASRAREASLTAVPITAEQAEKWGLVNHVVEGSELLKKARQIAEAIIKNNKELVPKYKAVINDGFKLDLGHALALEKERAHAYYDGMTKEQFEKMQEFIAEQKTDLIHSSIQFEHFDVVQREASDHHYLKKNNKSGKNNLQDVNSSVSVKIMKEWKILEKNLPESIYVQVYETRIDLLRAVIIGSPGTPYHDGLFFFDILLPYDYPEQPPKVYYHSHGYRLNPNLYTSGKLCLSLINTWTGTKVEKWTQKSTILQLLVSIQGLVLNDRPYFNEPGYGVGKNSLSSRWINASIDYNEDAFILSCKTMLQVIRKPPEGFEVFVAQHFRERLDSILAAFKAYEKGSVLVGQFRINEASSSSSSLVRVSPKFKANLKGIRVELVKAFKTTNYVPNMENLEEPNGKTAKKRREENNTQEHVKVQKKGILGAGADLKMGSANESFPQFDIATDFSDHKYAVTQKQSTKLGEKSTKAIMKEWKFLQNGLPESIYVRVYEQRIDLLRAAIIGPPKTPYHNGLFFFDFQMPSDYPQNPPKVMYHSYGLRLNPNLYSSGYVCLSLLNTWNGPPSTHWTPNKSTILQVLLSLQALVLNDTPFYNEPVYANGKGKRFKNSSMSYNNTTFLYSCMTMKYLMSRPPKNFEGFVVEHFRLNSRFILSAYLAYVNGFVEVGKYEDEESYLDQRIKLKEKHMVKMREHLPHLFQFFLRIDPSLGEFRMELNEKIRRKCNEYAEKANAAESMNVKKRQPAGILRLLSKLFVCGSSSFNNNPPFLL